MGQIVHVRCLSCGFEKDIFSGGGRNDCNIDTILKALPDSGKQLLTDAVNRGAVRITIDREPCSCSFCGEIYALPTVAYTLDGAVRKLRGACPKCGKQSRIPKINPPTRCPDCGGEISSGFVGHWD